MIGSGEGSLDEVVATTLEADPELLPFLPVLLKDLDELGSSPEEIVKALREAGLARGARVLDLGCGKGAVSRAVARAFDADVLGVDGLAAFVEEATRRAAEEGLGDRCRFRHADLRDVAREGGAYDAVLYIAVGPTVLGELSQAVGTLRACVRPGGLIAIDDAFLEPGQEGRVPGYELYVEHAEALRRLTSHGDRLRVERVVTREEEEALNARNNEAIARRAAELAALHPEAAARIQAFVAGQHEECEKLETVVTGALWVLERVG